MAVVDDRLTIQLHELIAEAEGRFGQRESGWTIACAGFRGAWPMTAVSVQQRAATVYVMVHGTTRSKFGFNLLMRRFIVLRPSQILWHSI